MKKIVLLMAGLLAMAFTGSALAAGPTMFAVQNGSAVDKFVIADDGSVTTSPIGFNFDGTTGFGGFGTAAPVASLSVTAQASTATRGLVISQHTTNAASAIAGFRKSRGNEAAPTTVVSGDYVGAFGFKVYDGTSYVQTGSFGARVNGTVGTGSVPTEIYFCNNAANLTDCYGSGNVKMLIGTTGNVGIGTVTPTSKLQVVGLPTYASNVLAVAGGLTVGAFYTDGAGNVKVVF
jgi:hypothetical protein